MLKEIIGALLGLGGGILPEVIKLIRDKQDKKHELALLKIQIENQKILASQRLEEVAMAGSLAADKSAYDYAPVYKPEAGKDGILLQIVYAFNSLVRPLITYLFVGLYIWVKYAQFKIIQVQATNIYEAIIKLWTDTDASFVMMVVMFWFGGRQVARSFGRIK